MKLEFLFTVVASQLDDYDPYVATTQIMDATTLYPSTVMPDTIETTTNQQVTGGISEVLTLQSLINIGTPKSFF